jgi:hypothetical protein
MEVLWFLVQKKVNKELDDENYKLFKDFSGFYLLNTFLSLQ